MIIVKKPFIYLRDAYNWRYKKCSQNYVFSDPNRFMILEKSNREEILLKDSENNLTSKDAEYKIMTVNEFFKEVIYNIGFKNKEILELSDYSWDLAYVKLGLKVVRNANICIPLKIAFPLIIKNDEYRFVIAPIVNEGIEF